MNSVNDLISQKRTKKLTRKEKEMKVTNNVIFVDSFNITEWDKKELLRINNENVWLIMEHIGCRTYWIEGSSKEFIWPIYFTLSWKS